MVVLCDIDGVLADISHRLHFQREKDYEQFYSSENLKKDAPISSGMKLLETLLDGSMDCQDRVLFVTGRPLETFNDTWRWLGRHLPTQVLETECDIIMRHDGDHRPSPEVKTEFLREWYDIDDERPGYDTSYYE